jgi:serine/threonine protein kinase
MRNTGLPYDCASALGDSVGSFVSASSVHRASSSSSSLRPSSSGQEDGKLDRSQFTAQAKIVDFGTSANLWRGGSQKLQREMGTLNWMPPEVSG